MTQPAHDTTTAATGAYGIRPPGFRLPDDTRLGRVVLQVASLDRSLAYYERVLGMRMLGREAGVARLGAGDGAELLELRERAGAHPVPRRGRLGLYHFAILLPERAALARFVEHLAQLGVHAGMSDHLVSEAIYLTDPDGLGIEVYADRPRSAWRARDGQVEMATEPLDTANLLRAKGDQAWSGMPAGTVIGHVHLFVSDLERASRFYHEGLGLDRVVWNYRGALFLGAGGYHHHLGTNTWAADAPTATDEDARLLEWTVVLPEAAAVERAAESIRGAGGRVESSGADRLATDPWGTRLRLVAG